MTEPTISCPQCKTEIKLTESLAALLVEATKREYQQRIERNSLDCARREETVRLQEQKYLRAQQDWRAGEDQRLREEKCRIAKEEARRAELKFSNDLEQKMQEIAHLGNVLKSRDEKLAEAQRTQA